MGEKLKPGDRIGKYRIIEHIGEGGMGSVYRAKQLSMNREVALKVLSFKKEKIDPMLRKRFVNEARTAGKLNHENIIHVHDVAKHGDTFYFSMELIDGETVGHLLKEKETFDAVTSLTIAKGVLKALMAAGKLGIIHRDIKPDNIIITKDGITKVSDLGLAKRADIDKGGSITQEGIVMGTPHYMSPEQARGEQLDQRSDIYSLGATLFHMLTGRTPFSGKSSYAIISEVIKGGFPYPADIEPSIPVAVSDLVVRMMSKSPDERFKSPGEVIKEIERIEEDEGRAVSRRLYSTGKRKRAWWRACIAGAVLLGIIIPAFIVMTSTNGDQTDHQGNGESVTIPPDDNGGEGDQTSTDDKEQVYPYIFGKAEKGEDGKVSVIYDFSADSQLDDWIPDVYWRKKMLRARAYEVMKGIRSIKDYQKIALLRTYRLQYTAEPPPWHIIDGTLVNNSLKEVEGFVSKLTWADDVSCEMRVEIKRARYPSIIVSFMNDQTGNGLSFNVGRFSDSEKNMFVASVLGRRKFTRPLTVPFPVETGRVYTVRFRKKGTSVSFWCSRDEKCGDPVFTTEVEGYRSGNIILWSSMGLCKIYRVRIEGTLIPLNTQGWFVRAGKWTPRGEGYYVQGYRGTEAVLQYGGSPADRRFTAAVAGDRGFSDTGHVFFAIPVPAVSRSSRQRFMFGIKGDSVAVIEASAQASPADSPAGTGTVMPELETRYTVLRESHMYNADKAVLCADFSGEGLSLYVNGILFFRNPGFVHQPQGGIELRANTDVEIQALTVE